jgi:hypothetical protein
VRLAARASSAEYRLESESYPTPNAYPRSDNHLKRPIFQEAEEPAATKKSRTQKAPAEGSSGNLQFFVL